MDSTISVSFAWLRFHIKKLSFDRLSLLRTISWMLKPRLSYLKCAFTHFRKHFSHLHHVRYINKNICVAAFRLGWKWFTNYEAASYDEEDFQLIVGRNHYEQHLVLYYTSSVGFNKFFEKLNSRLRARKEYTTKIFGRFSVCNSIPTGWTHGYQCAPCSTLMTKCII